MRYYIAVHTCKIATWFSVVDRVRGRVMGVSDTFRDGDGARELAEIQCRALNKTRRAAKRAL